MSHQLAAEPPTVIARHAPKTNPRIKGSCCRSAEYELIIHEIKKAGIRVLDAVGRNPADQTANAAPSANRNYPITGTNRDKLARGPSINRI